MMSLKILLIIAYIVYCNANQITCYPKNTAAPTTSEPTREILTVFPSKNPFTTPPINELSIPPTEDPIESKPLIVVPNIDGCTSSPYLDVIILNDISCSITETQCHRQLAMIGETILAIKSITPDDAKVYQRVAYFEFDSTSVYQIIGLNRTYNHNPVEQQDRESFYKEILNQQSCDTNNMLFNRAPQNTATPVLDEALKQAYQHFKDYKATYAREKKIVIFSNCKADPLATIPTVCSDSEAEIINDPDSNVLGLNVVMINNGENFVEDDMYVPCLIEYDEHRVWNNPSFSKDEWDTKGMEYEIRREVCEHPTAAPTTDPTSDPTSERRRLNTFDITSGQGNAPCITMEIKLETENLLPLNTDPDPASNIAVIGKAIANVTGGVVSIPDTPIEEDGDDPADFPFWQPFDIDPSCDNMGQPQMEQYYAQDGTVNLTESLSIDRIETNDGFIATVSMTTQASAIYKYTFSSMPLNILYTCATDSIIITCGIYDINDVLVGGVSGSTSVSADNDPQSIEINFFPLGVELNAGTEYKIKFSGTYASGCGANELILGSNSRRRLEDDDREYINGADVVGTSSASACAAGESLAKSKSMKAAVNAMCKGARVNLDNMKAGLFRQHNSNAQINDHLIKTGSISLYDPETGNKTYETPDFPGKEVKDPCIAVDDDENIIYAVGGRINVNDDGTGGTAVNYIQGYQLNDDGDGGEILDFNGEHYQTAVEKLWQLDAVNYGSTCLLWDDGYVKYLVVIGGMKDPVLEFTNKLGWYKTIKFYKIPKKSGDTLLVYPRAPSSGLSTLRVQLSDMKPLLVDNYLYLFGGKTDKTSIPFVERIDLNTAVSTTKDLFVHQLKMEVKKALPSIDETEYDGQGCYAAFSGQGYAEYEIDPNNGPDDTDTFQLFCNPKLNTRRRRLGGEENIWSDYDYEMLKISRENARMNRRDLQAQTPTEFFVRNYDYQLDDIWYNFTVQFELCYDNNDELSAAVDYYENVIEDKPNGNDWIEYDEELSERILNCSLEVYDEWSDGFGAVNVWDLSILDIRYEAEIDYTTHPQRRKARFWWSNLGNRNDDDDDWIDDKFDYTDDCDDEKKNEEV